MDSGSLEELAPHLRWPTHAVNDDDFCYDMLSDAIVWRDEMCLPPFPLMGVLRKLLRARTCLLLGAPMEFEDVWVEARRTIPEWQGFREQRTTQSASLSEFFWRRRREAFESLKRFEQLCDQQSDDAKRTKAAPRGQKGAKRLLWGWLRRRGRP